MVQGPPGERYGIVTSSDGIMSEHDISEVLISLFGLSSSSWQVPGETSINPTTNAIKNILVSMAGFFVVMV